MPSVSPGQSTTTDLARRMLHVNFNALDADTAQRFFVDCLGLALRMRTAPEVLTDGQILGLSGKVRCDTRFFYDSRGPRTSCAIEVIEWLEPTTASAAPASAGLDALGFRVADRAHTIQAISRCGFQVIATETSGLISDGPAALVVGSDGVVVEIGDLPEASSGSVNFAGTRIACADLDASLAFYTSIGFTRLSEIISRSVTLRDLGDNSDEPIDLRLCYIGLPEDVGTARICLVEHPRCTAPASKKPNQQGLYRCALRVENTEKAIASTNEGIAVRGPIWCPLPGTPIPGLHIAFLTAPDGTVIEYVERPLSHFGNTASMHQDG